MTDGGEGLEDSPALAAAQAGDGPDVGGAGRGAVGGSDEAGTFVAACKALGDRRRVRILRVLLDVPDTLCGCELSDILGLADYQVSRALGVLRKAGLVVEQARTGTWVHYAAARGTAPTVDRLLELVAALPLTPEESERLSLRYGLREQAGCVLGPQHPTVLATLGAGGSASSEPATADRER